MENKDTEILRRMAKDINDALSVSGTAVLMLNEEAQQLQGLLGEPVDEWFNIQKVKISLSEDVNIVNSLKRNETIISENAYEDEKTLKWMAQFYDCKSVIYLPITVKNEVIGVAIVSESRNFREFSPEEVEKAEKIIRLASEALSK